MSGFQNRLTSAQEREKNAVSASTEKDIQIMKLKTEVRQSDDKLSEAKREVGYSFTYAGRNLALMELRRSKGYKQYNCMV